MAFFTKKQFADYKQQAILNDEEDQKRFIAFLKFFTKKEQKCLIPKCQCIFHINKK